MPFRNTNFRIVDQPKCRKIISLNVLNHLIVKKHPICFFSFNSKSVLSLGSYVTHAKRSNSVRRQNRRFFGDRFFTFWPFGVDLGMIFSAKIRKISRFIAGTLESSTGGRNTLIKLSCHRDKFFWAKIFAEKKFPNRLQTVQNVKKGITRKSPVLPAKFELIRILRFVGLYRLGSNSEHVFSLVAGWF